MKNLGGTVALVTGASSGIGEAMALELARRGAAVVLAARRTERIEGIAERIRSQGGTAIAERCDVTADGDLKRCVARATGELGRLDWVVANAGFGVGGPFEKLGLDDYRRQLETNLFGVIRTAAASLDALRASRGCLAIVGSVNSFLALPTVSAYCVSKFAVRAFARSLHHELKPDGVAVTLLAPGFVESEIRKVDNRGRYREEFKDTVPRWLVMPADSAARKMVDAMVRRRRTAVITLHGKLFVVIERHAPWLAAWLVDRSAVNWRRPPADRRDSKDGPAHPSS